MEFVDKPPDVIRSVQHRWLLKCWRRVRGPRLLPLWSQFELGEIARCIDQMIFFDVVSDDAEPRFRIRHQGARITEAYGADCRGKFLDETQPANTRDTTLATYRHAVKVRLPVYTISDTRDAHHRPVHYERLLLPFTHDGYKISRIASLLETLSPEGQFEQTNLMVAPPVPQYSLCATIRVDILVGANGA